MYNFFRQKKQKNMIIIFVLLSVIFLFTITTTSVSAYTPGDVNDDGRIDIHDLTLVIRHTLGIDTLSVLQFQAADVNGDGVVDVRDATLIAQKALGIINNIDDHISDNGEDFEPEICTFVALEIVPLKSGPGTGYETLTQLRYGTRIKVIDTKDNWLLVETGYQQYAQGWLNRDYVLSGYGPFSCNDSDYGINIDGVVINLFMKDKEIVDLIGGPEEIVKDDWDNPIYIYPDLKLYFFHEDTGLFGYEQPDSEEYILAGMEITGNEAAGPRNIKIGNSFNKVLGLFPDEDNPVKLYSEPGSQYEKEKYRRILYGHDPYGLKGYAYYDSEQQPLRIWLSNYPESYLQLHFENEVVTKIYLYAQVI